MLQNGNKHRAIKVILTTMLVCTCVNIASPFVVDAFKFRGGNVFDESRFKQMIEWVKKEQEKLEKLKARAEQHLEAFNKAKQTMNSVKSSIDRTVNSANVLRNNVNSVMTMAEGIVKLDFNNSRAGWSEIQYARTEIKNDSDYMSKKVENNSLINHANLSLQKVANGLNAITDANQETIKSLQKLGRNTDGLLDIEEVRTEMKATVTDTALQQAKTRANQMNVKFQEKVIQAENQWTADTRRKKDFYTTANPNRMSEEENNQLKRLGVESKPGRGFVEF